MKFPGRISGIAADFTKGIIYVSGKTIFKVKLGTISMEPITSKEGFAQIVLDKSGETLYVANTVDNCIWAIDVSKKIDPSKNDPAELCKAIAKNVFEQGFGGPVGITLSYVTTAHGGTKTRIIVTSEGNVFCRCFSQETGEKWIASKVHRLQNELNGDHLSKEYLIYKTPTTIATSPSGDKLYFSADHKVWEASNLGSKLGA